VFSRAVLEFDGSPRVQEAFEALRKFPLRTRERSGAAVELG
jgi:hypothetical protein